ncbi:ankyrin repeat domain-containing protein 54-like [Colletes gigas]|uniref:ankyrin repeat domain-containing protein 54-like n=1 Tax=Colletes gigas TaxID=935657 RepID=UPI001C9AF0B0|nr:ankyrin repeat domain-containing protein 54-like [Colletes gigas]
MTSVDSGVETGNDSNDSSIVPYENLSSNQTGNVSSTVATTNSSEKEVHENEPGTFHIEFVPIGLHSPISSLCIAGPVVVCSKVLEFGFPRTYNVDRLSISKEVLKDRSMYHRKMKSFCASIRSRHYVTCSNIRDPFLEHKMRLAAATNNTSMMKRLLCSGVSPNNHDEKGRTALHFVSCRGYTEMAKLLLEYGADPNQHDYLGNTPLHLAAVACQISVVTLLVKAGADILSLDHHGYSPLQLAQTKLKLLQNCKGEDMLRVKEEIHNIVNMLLAYLQKQKDAHEKVECLSSFYSRLSLSNTSDQVQDDVKDLLANLDALSITS